MLMQHLKRKKYPFPLISSDNILIKVQAFGINFADVMAE